MEKFTKRNLVLKGGTAINVIYYSELRRLSVDLDFDLASNTPKEEMLEVKNKVSEKITVIVENLGY